MSLRICRKLLSAYRCHCGILNASKINKLINICNLICKSFSQLKSHSFHSSGRHIDLRANVTHLLLLSFVDKFHMYIESSLQIKSMNEERISPLRREAGLFEWKFYRFLQISHLYCCFSHA